jgi:hypothetical protein
LTAIAPTDSDAGEGNQPPSDLRGDPGGSSGQKDSTRDPVSPCISCTSEITRLQGEVETLTKDYQQLFTWMVNHSADREERDELTAQLAKAEATLQAPGAATLKEGIADLREAVNGLPDRSNRLHLHRCLDEIAALLPSAAVAPEKDTQ